MEESHYSVMDCTCHMVSALFISPKHYPRPLSAFPYPSEIYHVKALATKGMAARALDCFYDLLVGLNEGLSCE